MDVRTIKATALRRMLGIGVLTAAAMTNGTAHAAQASVQVDVNLPTVLVMYHWDLITLNLDQAALGGFLVGGTAAACNIADNYCDAQGAAAAVDVTAIAATTNVANLPALNDPGLANTTATFVLEDAVGVRAFGCATYTANYAALSTDAGVTITPGPVTGIDGNACSFLMTTGDLSFDLDFSAVAAGVATVSAVFDVTITGA